MSMTKYLLFLLLEWGDAVGEEFVIFLGALACDLGGNQLAMQGLIVVVLIDIQVHVGHLLPELARLHLLLELVVLFHIGRVSRLICSLRLTNLLFIVLLLKLPVSVFLYITRVRNFPLCGICGVRARPELNSHPHETQ